MICVAVLWELPAALMCASEDTMRQGNLVADKAFAAVGMDRMALQGYKRQRTMTQLLFESVPQVLCQACIFLGIFDVGGMMETSASVLLLSLTSSLMNMISQAFKVVVEARGPWLVPTQSSGAVRGCARHKMWRLGRCSDMPRCGVVVSVIAAQRMRSSGAAACDGWRSAAGLFFPCAAPASAPD